MSGRDPPFTPSPGWPARETHRPPDAPPETGWRREVSRRTMRSGSYGGESGRLQTTGGPPDADDLRHRPGAAGGRGPAFRRGDPPRVPGCLIMAEDGLAAAASRCAPAGPLVSVQTSPAIRSRAGRRPPLFRFYFRETRKGSVIPLRASVCLSASRSPRGGSSRVLPPCGCPQSVAPDRNQPGPAGPG